MWWSRSATALAILVALSSCGFQSLYGESGSQRVEANLAAIKIALIPDRIGQQLYNELRDDLNPVGQPARPRYELHVRLEEAIEELAIRKDETATRANLILHAEFKLIGLSDATVVAAGHIFSTTSYNILSSEFATLSALADARRRGVRALGNDIKSRLGLYFKGGGG